MDEDISQLQKQLAEIMSNIDQFKATTAPLQSAKSQLEKEQAAAYQEYQERMAKIRAEKDAIDKQFFDANRAIREAEQKARQLQYKLDEAEKKRKEEERLKAQMEQFKTLEEEWDRLTMGAPWREWAKDHQLSGGKKITYDNKVILADTMGLGKTLTSIITLDMVQAATRHASPDNPWMGEVKQVYDYNTGGYTDKIVGAVEKPCGLKVLYFCPAPMIGNVIREFRTWTKHRSVTSVGSMPKAERNFVLDLLTDAAEYVVVCNYEAWRKDLSLIDSFIDRDFDTVIIDEAHNIKDKKSIAYRGIKRLIDEMQPPFVIPMTGTPILNRPQELHSILTLIDPSKFHSENFFLQDYCQQNMDGKWVFQPGGMDRLAKRLNKHFLRRTKEQAGILLPPKTVNIHEIEIDEDLYPRQAKAREQMRKHAMIMLDPTEGKAIQAAAAIAVYTRLRQIETWPAGIEIKDAKTGEVKLKVDIEESQKLDYAIRFDPETKEFEGIIPEVIQDERVVVFSQFKAPLHELRDRCERAGYRAVVLDGSTSDKLKQEIQMDFDVKYMPEKRSDQKYDIVLCNYKVGGVGMNLTGATQMIIVDEEWNPGKRDQAYDRIHRMGQDKPVTIHVLRDKPSVDDWLAALIQTKENLVDAFETGMDLAAAGKEALESGLI